MRFRERRITTLTFDCYGTIVDWERGACAVLRSLLVHHSKDVSDDELVSLFLKADRRLTACGVMPYRKVLAEAAGEVARRLDTSLDGDTLECFVASLPSWPIFEDVHPALEQLARHYRLAIVSNTDEALISETLNGLSVRFDVVVTSEAAGSYKPDPKIFAHALRELNEPPEQIVHVAEGLCEAEPARQTGMGSVWVRRSDRSNDGSGVVPDVQVGGLAEVVQLLLPKELLR